LGEKGGGEGGRLLDFVLCPVAVDAIEVLPKLCPKRLASLSSNQLNSICNLVGSPPPPPTADHPQHQWFNGAAILGLLKRQIRKRPATAKESAAGMTGGKWEWEEMEWSGRLGAGKAEWSAAVGIAWAFYYGSCAAAATAAAVAAIVMWSAANKWKWKGREGMYGHFQRSPNIDDNMIDD
jgi:hypothetical protein